MKRRCRKDERAVKTKERKGAGDTKNAKRKEERRMDEGEERNAPGAWMRGEERKNESAKEGERRIEGWWRPRPGRYDHYHHRRRHLCHDAERGTWFLRECIYRCI